LFLLITAAISDRTDFLLAVQFGASSCQAAVALLELVA